MQACLGCGADAQSMAGGAEFVTTVELEHGLHQLVLKSPGSVGRDPKPPAQLDVGYSLGVPSALNSSGPLSISRTSSRSDTDDCFGAKPVKR
jgi:hypothetical protein